MTHEDRQTHLLEKIADTLHAIVEGQSETEYWIGRCLSVIEHMDEARSERDMAIWLLAEARWWAEAFAPSMVMTRQKLEACFATPPNGMFQLPWQKEADRE